MQQTGSEAADASTPERRAPSVVGVQESALKVLTSLGSLERFVRKMEAKQDEAIDAALNVNGTSDEGMAMVMEEACWGSARNADGDAEGNFDEGTHVLDRHPDTMVEPAHQTAAPRREGAHANLFTRVCDRETECSKCERKSNSRLEVPVCYKCRDKCSRYMRRFYSASGKKVCVGCRR